MAGNLELRNFLFIELMLVNAPSAANVERSFSLMNSIQLLNTFMRVALSQFKFDAEEVLLH